MTTLFLSVLYLTRVGKFFPDNIKISPLEFEVMPLGLDISFQILTGLPICVGLIETYIGKGLPATCWLFINKVNSWHPRTMGAYWTLYLPGSSPTMAQLVVTPL